MAEGEALRELYVRFSAEVEGAEELDRLDEHADHAKHSVAEAGEHAEHSAGLFKHLGEALEGVAAVFAGSELLHGIRETTEELEGLAHLSEQTGIATKDIEFFSYVVGQAGGDVGDFKGQLSALQRSLSHTEAATSPQAAALDKLGIATKGANGESREMSEVLPEIFENFGKLKNPAEEAAVAQRLFGKSGLALIPVLREGKKGFDEYRESFEATGGATPEESIKRAQEYEKALKRMGAAFGDLKTHLVTGVLPALTHTVELLTHGTARLSGFLKGTTAADHAVVALAAAFAGPLLGALRPFLGPGLKFLAIYAAVDDLLAFLEGKQSLIGDLLNAMFGDGTADQVRAWVLDAKNAFTDFAGSAQATFEALENTQSSFTEKAIASFVALVRDAAAGFPAIRASWAMNLDGMAAGLTEFVAGALEKWNALVEGLKVPPALRQIAALLPGAGAAIEVADKAASAVQVDTSGLRASAADLRKRQADRAAEVQASIAGIRSNTFGTEAGGTVARQALADQAAGGPAARTLTGQQAREAAGLVQTTTLAGASAAGVTAIMNDNKEINLHFQANATEDFKRTVKQAVADALADDNRVALQQITQRAAKQ